MKKLEALKVGGSKEKIKENNMFCELKSLFFFRYFFITPCPLHFQDYF